jgi:hypothetical protein
MIDRKKDNFIAKKDLRPKGADNTNNTQDKFFFTALKIDNDMHKIIYLTLKLIYNRSYISFS